MSGAPGGAGSFILGYALFRIPGGHLADRVGAHRTLALMGFGSATFTGLSALAGTSVMSACLGIVLAAIRFGLGVVKAPLYPACACVTGFFAPVLTPIIASRSDCVWLWLPLIRHEVI